MKVTFEESREWKVSQAERDKQLSNRRKRCIGKGSGNRIRQVRYG
jgi:hypothetical protein